MKKVFTVMIFLLSLIVLVGCIEEEPTVETEKTIVALTIKTAPTTTTYELGATTLNTAGLEVEAVYSDLTVGILTSSQYTISGFNGSQSGVQTITVTAGGKTATFTVVVSDPEAPVTLLALQVANMPYRTMYVVGQSFTTDGIVIEALYSDASKRTLEAGEATFSGFSSTVSGKKNITVSFGGKCC